LNWIRDLEAHGPEAPPLWRTGRLAPFPANPDVVEGGAKCYLQGVPRATYMPYPFRTMESPKDILVVYEFASANRLVDMGKPVDARVANWPVAALPKRRRGTTVWRG